MGLIVRDDELHFAVTEAEGVVHAVWFAPELAWWWQASDCGLPATRLREVKLTGFLRRCSKCRFENPFDEETE